MSATAIRSVTGRRVWDSRARPTVEAEIALAGGARGRAAAPAGASRGRGEARELRDGGAAFGGLGADRAAAAVSGEIARALAGLDACDQEAVDARLAALDGTPDKSRLGGNALVAVSIAAAAAAAAARGLPLWRHLAADGSGPATLPLPEIQIFGGGAHAARRLDVQDFMVVAVGAESFAQALDWSAEIHRHAGMLMAASGRLAGAADEGGFWPVFDSSEHALETLARAIEEAGFAPGEQVGIALDVAASEFCADGRYRLAGGGRALDGAGMRALLEGWIDRFPIVSVEDPLAEDDFDGFAAFTRAVGDRVQVVGDDALASDAGRVAEAARRGAGNAALLKPDQAGTLSECRRAFDAARAAGWGTIASARSGETEDVAIVHVAVGWGAQQLKVGALARGERTAKWNEGLRLAETLPSGGALPPRAAFPWGR